jgi:hypothetical protein
MDQLIWVFIRTVLSHLEAKVHKRGAITVVSLYKDHMYGMEVVPVESRPVLMPTVRLNDTDIYHGDGVYPQGLVKPPMFLVRSCLTKSLGANGDCIQLKF